MNALIVYDSQYGNTQKVAETISRALSCTVSTKHIKNVKPEDLKGVNLLVVGSPTQGGRPTVSIQTFLHTIPKNSLKNIRVAAFDTRILAASQKPWLRMLMKVIDYAAPRIAKELQGSGGKLVVPPEGFIVDGTEGPLKQGELTRAEAWAQTLQAQ